MLVGVFDTQRYTVCQVRVNTRAPAVRTTLITRSSASVCPPALESAARTVHVCVCVCVFAYFNVDQDQSWCLVC